jgi:hypothetical protein
MLALRRSLGLSVDSPFFMYTIISCHLTHETMQNRLIALYRQSLIDLSPVFDPPHCN